MTGYHHRTSWEGLGSSWVSLGASWEGLRVCWKGLRASWEGPGEGDGDRHYEAFLVLVLVLPKNWKRFPCSVLIDHHPLQGSRPKAGKRKKITHMRGLCGPLCRTGPLTKK